MIGKLGKGKLYIGGKFIGNILEIETKCSKTVKEKSDRKRNKYLSDRVTISSCELRLNK